MKKLLIALSALTISTTAMATTCPSILAGQGIFVDGGGQYVTLPCTEAGGYSIALSANGVVADYSQASETGFMAEISDIQDIKPGADYVFSWIAIANGLSTPPATTNNK